MKITAIELHRVAMPLIRPFVTSFGRQITRDVLLVHVISDTGDGWGECVSGSAPLYSAEYVDGAEAVIRNFMAPALLAEEVIDAWDVARVTKFVSGHRMAKAALEMAVLDAQLRSTGQSFASYFGATRTVVDCGVSVGIAPSIPELLDEVRGYVDAGYKRIKLKVKPGWDLEPTAAVRDLIGPDLMLQVDANTAYTSYDVQHLQSFDDYGLTLIEQPFAEEDFALHILLAAAIRTPICLDESIVSADVAVDAIQRGATSVVNIKAGRVGGYLEAVRIHDVCQELHVAVWCGGMLESGLGRAANVALAALPWFTLPGDTSASARYFAEDLTEPFVLHDGQLTVPTGAGTGVEVRTELLRDWALREPLTLTTAMR